MRPNDNFCCNALMYKQVCDCGRHALRSRGAGVRTSHFHERRGPRRLQAVRPMPPWRRAPSIDLTTIRLRGRTRRKWRESPKRVRCHRGKSSPDGHQFVGLDPLTDAEIDIFQRWVADGAREGDRRRSARAPAAGGRIGSAACPIWSSRFRSRTCLRQMAQTYRGSSSCLSRSRAALRSRNRVSRRQPADSSCQHPHRPHAGVTSPRRRGSGAGLRRHHPAIGALSRRPLPRLDTRTGRSSSAEGPRLDADTEQSPRRAAASGAAEHGTAHPANDRAVFHR